MSKERSLQAACRRRIGDMSEGSFLQAACNGIKTSLPALRSQIFLSQTREHLYHEFRSVHRGSDWL